MINRSIRKLHRLNARPLVDLSNWASLTYPETYQDDLYNLSQEDVRYLKSVRATSMYHMFYECWRLSSIDTSNWDTSACTNMSGMFYGCVDLNSYGYLDLSNFDTSNVTDMSDMFYQCTIRSINLANWDTSACTNMSGMFCGCESLQYINLANWDTSNVINISSMFTDLWNGPESLDLSSFDTSSVTDMRWVFYESDIGIIDMSNWDTSSVTAMNSMFTGSSIDYLIIDSPTFKFQMKDSSCGNLPWETKILVPQALLSTYQNATNWSSRTDQFDAIENYTITRSNGTITVTPNTVYSLCTIYDDLNGSTIDNPDLQYEGWFEYQKQSGDETLQSLNGTFTSSDNINIINITEGSYSNMIGVYFWIELVDTEDGNYSYTITYTPGSHSGVTFNGNATINGTYSIFKM